MNRNIKKILAVCLGLFLVNGLFALDLGKVEQVWDKSMDIAITELDNLKDFNIPKAEEVEAKVNREMYVSELESKVVQLEAEINLLKKEKDELVKDNERAYTVNNDLRDELEYYKQNRILYEYKRVIEDRELEIILLEKENNRLKELLKRKIKY